MNSIQMKHIFGWTVIILKRINIKNMIPEYVLTYEYATRTRMWLVIVEWCVSF